MQIDWFSTGQKRLVGNYRSTQADLHRRTAFHQRFHLLVVVLMLVTLWLQTDIARAADSLTVTGQVVDKNTNTPVAGVPICLVNGVITPVCVTTDIQGNYSFQPVSSIGNYTVVSPSPMTVPTKYPISFIGGESTQVANFQVPKPKIWNGVTPVAHRGDVFTSPEMSWAAFDRATTKGAPQTEFDVYLNKDDKPVIAHSSIYQNPIRPYTDVTRPTGPSVECWGKSFEDIDWSIMSKCDTGSYKDDKFNNERFIFLEDLLKTYPDYAGWMIELKDTRSGGIYAYNNLQLGPPPVREGAEPLRVNRNRLLGQKVTALLKQYNRTDVWVTSFQDSCLDGVDTTGTTIKKNAPTIFL